ncbi:MAG: peptidyl-prolyl cis-trans isomerase, partial [Bacteroidales bacterium]|nr:peptidyl-prolyl cis-trans isomerase [Bacteroidales bacterium]
MKIKNLFIIFIMIILLPDFSQAQDPDEKVFLTVAGREVKTGEFLRMFNKSMDAESQTGIDLYLEQFINFKLKVAEAIEEGYDTTRAFREELNGYRNQLAQHYLTDTETKGRLLRKAYERSLNEVNAWHILVNCSPDDSPEDTLKAWKKATDIRERIIKGEPFEQVARSTSDDKSVTLNGGNLGYFSVFQMIMPFEDAVYTMKPGTISMPVRTSYGYHIIRLADKR